MSNDDCLACAELPDLFVCQARFPAPWCQSATTPSLRQRAAHFPCYTHHTSWFSHNATNSVRIFSCMYLSDNKISDVLFWHAKEMTWELDSVNRCIETGSQWGSMSHYQFANFSLLEQRLPASQHTLDWYQAGTWLFFPFPLAVRALCYSQSRRKRVAFNKRQENKTVTRNKLSDACERACKKNNMFWYVRILLLSLFRTHFGCMENCASSPIVLHLILNQGWV